MRRRDFFRRNDELRLQQAKAAPEIAPTPAQADAPKTARKIGECSKCGRIIGRGLYFHEKSCHGHIARG